MRARCDLGAVAWPDESVDQALATLAAALGVAPAAALPAGAGLVPTAPHPFEGAAARAGLSVEALAPPQGRVPCAPGSGALLRVRCQGAPRLVAVLRGGRRHAIVLGPDLRRHRVRWAALDATPPWQATSCTPAPFDRLLDGAGVPARRRRAAWVEQPGAGEIRGWLLRPAPESGLRCAARRARLGWHLAASAVLQAIQYGLWVVLFGVLGEAALQQRLDRPATVMLLLIIPAVVITRWSATLYTGRLSLRCGMVLKRQTLAGSLRLEPEEIRRRGTGEIMGLVFESEELQNLALSGGYLALVGAIELVIAAVVLIGGTHAALLATLLLGWLGLGAGAVILTVRHRRSWTMARLELTNRMVALLLGHRTRLAQDVEPGQDTTEGPDIERYLRLGRRMDRSAILLTAVLPRGWLVIGAAGIGTGLGAGGAPAVAAGLGGVLLSYRALHRLGIGMAHLAGVSVGWGRIAPLLRAATQPAETLRPESRRGVGPSSPDTPLLDAQGLTFRYPRTERTVLDGCGMQLRAGDRVALEGPSGAGKSTLGAVLTGLRLPEGGSLRVRGLDRREVGLDRWRELVAGSPQFHENHVLSASFLFNLLMGRRWPPSPDDLEEASRICVELGLDEVVGRMPGGMGQMIGETGWQLSQGERGRLYLARTLLQGADVVVLDESFAALDAETMSLSLDCAERRARTMVVITHG